jgi:hypothetical protein
VKFLNVLPEVDFGAFFVFFSKTLLLLAACAVIAGCQTPTPPTAPAPADLNQEATALSNAASIAGVKDAATYVRVGYELVDRECGTFFDALDKAEDQATFARQELTLGGAGAAGILSALKAGTVPITITGIAVPLVANSIENYQNTKLLTPYPDETYSLIKAALKSYQAAATAPVDIYDAAHLVQGYASICTYAGIHQLAKQALNNAKPSDQQTRPQDLKIGEKALLQAHIPNIVVQ